MRRDEDVFLKRLRAVQPHARWRCDNCMQTGRVRVSSSGYAASFLNYVQVLHQELSGDCTGARLVIEVPRDKLPTRAEQRAQEHAIELGLKRAAQK